jgi:RHS repeat-associated protein
MERGTTRHTYLTDHLGTVRALADASGAVARTYAYDSYGNRTAETGTLANPFTYTAREFEEVGGLYYHRARWYDAVTGSFVSRDPIGFGGRVANTYSYALASPVGATDPTGEFAQIAAGALLAGALNVAAQGYADLYTGCVSSPLEYLNAFVGGAVSGAIASGGGLFVIAGGAIGGYAEGVLEAVTVSGNPADIAQGFVEGVVDGVFGFGIGRFVPLPIKPARRPTFRTPNDRFIRPDERPVTEADLFGFGFSLGTNVGKASPCGCD